jgi:hypothetical protein
MIIGKNIANAKWVFVIMVLGIFLRTAHYLENRSLWLDEAWVAHHVSNLNVWQILANIPFDSNLPIPPMGFALVEKSIVSLWDHSEYALRLFPLLCGMFSIFLYHRLLGKIAQPSVMWLALAFFAFSGQLIYYAAEVKQYSSDVLAALLLYLAAHHYQSQKILSVLQLFVFGLAMGTIFLFFSHTAIFSMGGIALGQTVGCLRRRDFRRLQQQIMIYLQWGIVFLLFYQFYLHRMLQNELIVEGAAKFFLPYPIWSGQGLHWLIENGYAIFKNPIGLIPGWLALMFAIMGIVASVKGKDTIKVLTYVSPVFLALLAAVIHRYPFHQRYLLFILPGIYWLIAEGVIFCAQRIKRPIFLKYALTNVLLVSPLGSGFVHLYQGHGREMIRPVMNDLQRSFHAGDALYINAGAYAAYYYYGARFATGISQIGRFSDEVYHASAEGKTFINLRTENPIYNQGIFKGLENDSPVNRAYQDDICIFGNNARTWFLFSHPKNSRTFVFSYLEKRGKRLDTLRSKDVDLYLYDLSQSCLGN